MADKHLQRQRSDSKLTPAPVSPGKLTPKSKDSSRGRQVSSRDGAAVRRSPSPTADTSSPVTSAILSHLQSSPAVLAPVSPAFTLQTIPQEPPTPKHNTPLGTPTGGAFRTLSLEANSVGHRPLSPPLSPNGSPVQQPEEAINARPATPTASAVNRELLESLQQLVAVQREELKKAKNSSAELSEANRQLRLAHARVSKAEQAKTAAQNRLEMLQTSRDELQTQLQTIEARHEAELRAQLERLTPKHVFDSELVESQQWILFKEAEDERQVASYLRL